MISTVLPASALPVTVVLLSSLLLVKPSTTGASGASASSKRVISFGVVASLLTSSKPSSLPTIVTFAPAANAGSNVTSYCQGAVSSSSPSDLFKRVTVTSIFLPSASFTLKVCGSLLFATNFTMVLFASPSAGLLVSTCSTSVIFKNISAVALALEVLPAVSVASTLTLSPAFSGGVKV